MYGQNTPEHYLKGAMMENDLGFIAKHFESNKGGPGTISNGDKTGDPGGRSYGTHQLAERTGSLTSYVRQSRYRSDLANLKPATPEFDAKWKQLAEQDPEGFEADQRAYITKTHFNPVRRHGNGLGLPDTPAINEAVYSMSVQHGKANTIVSRASKRADFRTSSEADIVKALYIERAKYVMGLGSLSKDMKTKLLNRYQWEVNKVLELIE